MSTLIRASSTPNWTDCPRRAAAELLRDELIAAGFKLRRYKGTTIALAIGHAVDAGANEYLLAKKEGRDPTAPDAALAAFRDIIADGCDYDATTPNPTIAVQQIKRMVEVFRTQVLPDIRPDTIQLELLSDIGNGFELIGHWDNRDRDRLLHDLKTGADKWPVTPQIGSYVLLGEAHDLPIDAAVIDYIERAPVKRPQPPATKTYYEAELVRRHAIAVIKRIKRDVTSFRQSQDPDSIPANPFSFACSKKNCPAYNVDGEGREWCQWWRR